MLEWMGVWTAPAVIVVAQVMSLAAMLGLLLRRSADQRRVGATTGHS